MKVYRLCTVITALISLCSCGSAQLAVESDPIGAEISVSGPAVGRQIIGKTPMTLTKMNVPQLFSENLQISVSKAGYHGESFLVPQASGSIQSKIQATLSVDSVSKTCQDTTSAMNEATDAVAQVQRLIYGKAYSEAEKALSGYTIKFSAVATFHSLLGNVYYLQKNVDKALESYMRANSLQPQNQETQRMIEKIKSIRGGGT